MSLTLKSVPASRGLQWVRDGLRLFGKKPLAFTSLFVLFLLAAVVVSLVPLLGSLVQLMSMPLLSLGFMVAARSALLAGEVKPSQLIEPLRTDAKRRRELLWMGVIYGVAAIAILWFCDWLSDEFLLRLQKLMAKPGATPAELQALVTEPGVQQAAIFGAVLGTALTVPFWHAPALVHWGGQGLAQSLFSSSLAVWRSKGAFLVYGLAWLGLIMALGYVLTLVLGLLGLGRLVSMVLMPLGLAMSAAFYVSLIFTFNDCFGSGPMAPPSDASEVSPGPL